MFPLRQAIFSKNTDMLEDLLKNGADPNKPFSDKIRPLYSSIINGSVKTTELLLKYGADPNLKMEEDNKYSSALGCAMFLKRTDTVYLLLKHCANMHTKEDIHATVYEYAFVFNYFNVIDMFYRADKRTLVTLVMVANRLSSEKDNALDLPRELWRHIVIQFSPIGIKIPF
jgi:hypothetical protein